jgi:hypothetical protein
VSAEVRVHAARDGSSVIRTAALTIVSGGATFLVTNGLDQPQAICIMLSILIGGIALMVRFLVDFENRLAAVEKLERDGMDDMKRLVGDAFSEISEATALFGLIERSALQTDLVTQLVRNSTQIGPDSPTIVYKFVQAKIREMSDFLKQIGEGGTVTYYGEDRDWLLGLTMEATTSVDAISLAAVDHDLWQSEIGQRYLDAQRQAAGSGRRVRRIFVLEDARMEHDPELASVYKEQAEMNIQVRLLDRASVPTPLRSRVRDLIVFDDIVAYETTPNTIDPHLSQVSETRLVLTDARVKECSRLFRELWDLSRDPQTNA